MPQQFDIPKSVVQSVYDGKQTVEAYSPYMSSIHKEHIIAINVAYKLGNWIDVLFFGDDSFFKNFKQDIIDFKGLSVHCMKKPDYSYAQIAKPLQRAVTTGGRDLPSE